MEEKDPFAGRATFDQVQKDLMSKSKVFDVLYSDSLENQPKFVFYDSDFDAAVKFAESQPFAILVSHSAMSFKKDD